MDYLKNQMKKMYATSLVTSIIMFILGVFLLVRPDFIINIVSTIIGLVILVPGIISLIDYFKTKYMANLVIGVIAGVLGIVFIFNSKLISSILPFVLGIFFIVNGINRLQYALELRKSNNKNFVASLVISIVIILSGILFVINPFGGALVITKVMGVFMIIYSILDIVNSIIIKREVRNVEKIIEAQIVEKN